MQFFLLKWGRAPDPQFLLLGCAGAAGLCGLWMLILIPIERLRSSPSLRAGATVASLVGMLLALLFLSGKGFMVGISESIRTLDPRTCWAHRFF
jgi:hypothetical protein